MNFWKKFKRRQDGKILLTVLTCLLLILLALPWPLNLDAMFGSSLFGIPAGYLLVTLFFPLAMFLLALLYAEVFPDLKRPKEPKYKR